MQQPKVTEFYLKSSASIDIHSYISTGSLGFEDVWLMKTPNRCQFAGVMGFVFTSAYLAYNYFQKEPSFKKNLVNILISYKIESNTLRSSFQEDQMVLATHQLSKLPLGPFKKYIHSKMGKQQYPKIKWKCTRGGRGWGKTYIHYKKIC